MKNIVFHISSDEDKKSGGVTLSAESEENGTVIRVGVGDSIDPIHFSFSTWHPDLVADYAQHPVRINGAGHAPGPVETILFLLFLANAGKRLPEASYVVTLLAPFENLGRAANLDTFYTFDKRLSSTDIDVSRFYSALVLLCNVPLSRHSGPPSPRAAYDSYWAEEAECKVILSPCFFVLLALYTVFIYPLASCVNGILPVDSTDQPQRGCFVSPRRVFDSYWSGDALTTDCQVVFSALFLPLFFAYACLFYSGSAVTSCCFDTDQQGRVDQKGERSPLCPQRGLSN